MPHVRQATSISLQRCWGWATPCWPVKTGVLRWSARFAKLQPVNWNLRRRNLRRRVDGYEAASADLPVGDVDVGLPVGAVRRLLPAAGDGRAVVAEGAAEALREGVGRVSPLLPDAVAQGHLVD